MAIYSTFWEDLLNKIASIGKALIPSLAIFEVLRRLLGEWWQGLMDSLEAKFNAALGMLSVDLAPPAVIMSWIAKVNVVVPLSEAWQYFLSYLAIASVVLGIKWMRNLVPGAS